MDGHEEYFKEQIAGLTAEYMGQKRLTQKLNKIFPHASRQTLAGIVSKADDFHYEVREIELPGNSKKRARCARHEIQMYRKHVASPAILSRLYPPDFPEITKGDVLNQIKAEFSDYDEEVVNDISKLVQGIKGEDKTKIPSGCIERVKSLAERYRSIPPHPFVSVMDKVKHVYRKYWHDNQAPALIIELTKAEAEFKQL